MQIETLVHDDLKSVFGRFIVGEIKPDTAEYYLAFINHRIYKNILGDKLNWHPIRKQMFEFGPLVYPGCSTFVDTFTEEDRRALGAEYKLNQLYPKARNDYSLNKAYHKRINTILHYVDCFMMKDESMTGQVKAIRELYDDKSRGGWSVYYASPIEAKKHINKRVTDLAISIIMTELTQ